MNGFFFVDKPIGISSRFVCDKIEKKFSLNKTGHLGTLDPFASGLLIVAVNSATKALTFIEEADKEYVAELKLGIKTSTGDRTGEIIKESSIKSFTESFIKDLFKTFIGEIEQVPPMTSAIHYNGMKLYRLAHQGIEVERKARLVQIKTLELLSYKDNVITFKTLVSKGTYIRVLAETIAESLDTVGTLISLRRTKVGKYDISQAESIETLSETSLISINEMLRDVMPLQTLDDGLLHKAIHGMKISLSSFEIEGDKVLLIDKDNNPVAVYEKQETCYACNRGLR